MGLWDNRFLVLGMLFGFPIPALSSLLLSLLALLSLLCHISPCPRPRGHCREFFVFPLCVCFVDEGRLPSVRKPRIRNSLTRGDFPRCASETPRQPAIQRKSNKTEPVDPFQMKTVTFSAISRARSISAETSLKPQHNSTCIIETQQ